MDGDYGLSNLRFEGYTNEDLARQVDGLRDGSGSETLHNAVRALVSLAEGLAETDKTLREQLQEIGVSWEGVASEGGTAATEGASIYAEHATEPVTDSAKGVDSQGATFSNTRNSAPDSGTLRGPSEENFGDRVAGFFGHTTDHAKDVRATGQARDQAVDGLNDYQSSSSDALDRSQALPVPPGMNLVAQPVELQQGTTSVSGFNTGGGLNPSGGPGAGAGSGPGPLGGSGGNPLPTTGGPPVGGPPGQQFGSNPLNVGGVPTSPGANPAAAGLRAPINPMLMAEGAAMMGAGGAGGAGVGADRERTMRGGGGTGGAAGKGAVPGRSVPLGAAPDDEARAARNAERFGARTGRAGSSIMQPAAAAGRGNADGEDDQEHVRRYGIDSGDVFDDDRVVAPESIGDEPDDH